MYSFFHRVFVLLFTGPVTVTMVMVTNHGDGDHGACLYCQIIMLMTTTTKRIFVKKVTF